MEPVFFRKEYTRSIQSMNSASPLPPNHYPMQKKLAQFLYILDSSKHKLPFLVALFLLNSLLDSFGIGLIAPFIAVASSPDIIYNNHWINWIYQLSGLVSVNYFVALLGLMIIGTFGLKTYLSYISNTYIYSFSFKHTAELRKRLMHAYLAAPYSFYLKSNSALLIQNLTDETRLFCHGILLPILFITTNGILIFFLASLLTITSSFISGFVFGLFLLILILYSRTRHKIASSGKNISEASGELIRIVNHSVGGIKETRIIGCESYFEEQFKIQVSKIADAYLVGAKISQQPRLLLEATLVTSIISFISLSLLINGDIQSIIPTLSVFALAAIRLVPSISQFSNSLITLRQNDYVLEKLYLILKDAENQDNIMQKDDIEILPFEKFKESELFSAKFEGLPPISSRVMPSISFHKSINFDNITFSYPNIEQPALRQMSFSISKGETIGLIGKSGAGKTTLVDVILGLLIPQSGDVLVDGKSIYGNLRSWQNLVGYIPQSIFLIDDTLERNIAFGVPDHLIDTEKLNRVIKSSQLEEFISQLPDGIKTPVGERGVCLSGGQRQRVGIARSLYHECEILVLDEATAALDNETEKLVTNSIRALSGEKTIIIIAHRLTTVEHCDRIYLLDNGKILKSGSYQEVVIGKQV